MEKRRKRGRGGAKRGASRHRGIVLLEGRETSIIRNDNQGKLRKTFIHGEKEDKRGVKGDSPRVGGEASARLMDKRLGALEQRNQ